MPAGYLKLKRKYGAKKAARIWNSKNPDNPVTRKHKKRKKTLLTQGG